MTKKVLVVLSLSVVGILFVVIGLTRESAQPLDIPQALTQPDRYFMQPVWSPDGEHIAMAGENYDGIWVMDSNGANLRQITNEQGAGFKFAWSSDTRQIAARVQQLKGRRRSHIIKVYSLETGAARTVQEFSSKIQGYPIWTQQNTQICVYTKKSFEVLDVDHGGKITGRGVEPQNEVLLAASNPLILADAEGQILSEFKPVDGTYLNAALSPNDRHIAFEVLGGNLYVVDTDGSHLTDLGRGERPCWSPDSQWIAFVIPTDDGHQLLSSDIFVIRRDGTEKRSLTDSKESIEMNPDWSPDGQTIIFNEKVSGQIYKLRVPEL